jgi:hypothetical protein
MSVWWASNHGGGEVRRAALDECTASENTQTDVRVQSRPWRLARSAKDGLNPWFCAVLHCTSVALGGKHQDVLGTLESFIGKPASTNSRCMRTRR